MRWKLRLHITRKHWLIVGFATIATLNYRWGGYEVAVWTLVVLIVPWLRGTLTQSWTINLSRNPWISIRRDREIPPIRLPQWTPEDDEMGESHYGTLPCIDLVEPPDDFDGEMTPSELRRLK